MSKKEIEPLIVIAQDSDDSNKIAISVNSDPTAWSDDDISELDRLYMAIQSLLVGVSKLSADMIEQGEDVSHVLPVVIEDLVRYMQASLPNTEIDAKIIDTDEAKMLGMRDIKKDPLPS